jgi:hypothetical protein
MPQNTLPSGERVGITKKPDPDQVVDLRELLMSEVAQSEALINEKYMPF